MRSRNRDRRAHGEELPPAFRDFRRLSVADQAAAAIRKAVCKGVWKHLLPSEHELAIQLKISRPSVHSALMTLKNEGLVAIRQGRLTQVVSRREPVNTPPIVCLVTPLSRKVVGIDNDPLTLELREKLARQGIGWDEIFDARIKGRRLNHLLKRIVGGRPRICWLLGNSSPELQRWFHHAGLPAVVFGSCQPGIPLPSVDSDYRAIGWHVAGCIARRGHKHVLVVKPHHMRLGDIACWDGIVDYIANAKARIVLTEIGVGPPPGQLKSGLDRLLAGRPRPTVIFTMLPEVTLATLFHLQHSGFKVPDDISLVSRENHNLFDKGIPEITRYVIRDREKIDAIIRMVQLTLAGRRVPLKPNLVAPRFIAGETLTSPSVE